MLSPPAIPDRLPPHFLRTRSLLASCALTPYLPQFVKFPGRKVHTCTPANSIFDGPVTTVLSILCNLVEGLSRAPAKRGKSLNDFKFSTSVGRFSSDGAAGTAVKGLILSASSFYRIGQRHNLHYSAAVMRYLFFQTVVTLAG